MMRTLWLAVSPKPYPRRQRLRLGNLEGQQEGLCLITVLGHPRRQQGGLCTFWGPTMVARLGGLLDEVTAMVLHLPHGTHATQFKGLCALHGWAGRATLHHLKFHGGLLKLWELQGKMTPLLLQLCVGQAKGSLHSAFETQHMSLTPCESPGECNVTLSVRGRCHLLAYQAPLPQPMYPYEAFPSCPYPYFRTTCIPGSYQAFSRHVSPQAQMPLAHIWALPCPGTEPAAWKLGCQC